QPVKLPVGFRVQVARARAETLAYIVSLHLGTFCSQRHRCRLAGRFWKVQQEGREQDGAAGPQQRLLQDALQLPDVARPPVAAQPRQRLRGDLLYLASELPAEEAQVVPHQQRQVVAPLTQRRQMDGEDDKSVV